MVIGAVTARSPYRIGGLNHPIFLQQSLLMGSALYVFSKARLIFAIHGRMRRVYKVRSVPHPKCPMGAFGAFKRIDYVALARKAMLPAIIAIFALKVNERYRHRFAFFSSCNRNLANSSKLRTLLPLYDNMIFAGAGLSVAGISSDPGWLQHCSERFSGHQSGPC